MSSPAAQRVHSEPASAYSRLASPPEYLLVGLVIVPPRAGQDDQNGHPVAIRRLRPLRPEAAAGGKAAPQHEQASARRQCQFKGLLLGEPGGLKRRPGCLRPQLGEAR